MIAWRKVHIPERGINTRFVTRAEVLGESLENRERPINAALYVYTFVSPPVEEPQTPQAGVVSPGWHQASSPSSTTPTSTTAATATAAWNTTGKSSVLRFYLHKMIGLTTSRSKCRPRWFSLRILLCSDVHTHTYLSFVVPWHFDFAETTRRSLSRMQMGEHTRRDSQRESFSPVSHNWAKSQTRKTGRGT